MVEMVGEAEGTSVGLADGEIDGLSVGSFETVGWEEGAIEG